MLKNYSLLPCVPGVERRSSGMHAKGLESLPTEPSYQPYNSVSLIVNFPLVCEIPLAREDSMNLTSIKGSKFGTFCVLGLRGCSPYCRIFRKPTVTVAEFLQWFYSSFLSHKFEESSLRTLFCCLLEIRTLTEKTSFRI